MQNLKISFPLTSSFSQIQQTHHILTTSVLTLSTTFSSSPIISPSLLSLSFLISFTSLDIFSYIFSNLSSRISSYSFLCCYSQIIDLPISSICPVYCWDIFLTIYLVNKVFSVWDLAIYYISAYFCFSIAILFRQLWFILLLNPASSMRQLLKDDWKSLSAYFFIFWNFYNFFFIPFSTLLTVDSIAASLIDISWSVSLRNVQIFRTFSNSSFSLYSRVISSSSRLPVRRPIIV